MKTLRKILAGLLTVVLAAGLAAFTPVKAYAAVDSTGIAASAYWYRAGWGDYAKDGMTVMKNGFYPTALRFTLQNPPEGLSGEVRYQVKIVGTDWLEECGDNGQAGTVEADAAIIGLKIRLTGNLAGRYDVHYKTMQNNGQWTSWAKNGVPCTDGSDGTFVLAVRVCLTEKGKEVPEPKPGQVDPSRPMVAVTFDDGPRASVTPRILSALEAVGGRATFFMIGKNVGANAGVVQRMVADGCEVGNHTWNHETISRLSAADLTNVLNVTNDTIQAACGIRPVVMRPPGGGYNDAALATVGNMGMSAFYWSIDTRDWQHRNPAKTISSVLDNVRDGDIILMHDAYSTTADAAEVIIPELVNRGYQLVTVSELCAARDGGAKAGKIYFSLRP